MSGSGYISGSCWALCMSTPIRMPLGARHPSALFSIPSSGITYRSTFLVIKLLMRMLSRMAESDRWQCASPALVHWPPFSANTLSASSRKPSRHSGVEGEERRSKRVLVMVRAVVWIAAKFSGMRRRDILSGVSSSWRPSTIARLMC